MQPHAAAIRRQVGTLAKLLFTGGLLAWLVSTDKLDFELLLDLRHHPDIVAALLAFWGIGGVLLCALRWRALVVGMNYQLAPGQSVKLNLIGLFFNSIMPGAVGGDVIKAIYVCKGQATNTRVPILLTILIDRVLGLVALFAISLVAVLLNWQIVAAYGQLLPLVYTLLLVVAGLAGGLLFLALPLRWKQRIPLLGLVYQQLLRLRLLRNAMDALRHYKSAPTYLCQAFALGVVHQLLHLMLFLLVTNRFSSQRVDIGVLATILPLGITTTAIPLAPSGVGVGHVAFDRLFAIIGMSGGANIFNVIIFALIPLNCLGCIPYLFMKGELAPLIAAAAEDGEASPATA